MLWSGGIGFAGVIAFIFADLIVLPIIAIYRKYYGNAYTVRIVALMFLTMVIAALAVDGLLDVAGLVPRVRPTRADIFSSIRVDYKLFTSIVGGAIFAVLFALTIRRGATDPVCRMKIDKAKALRLESPGETHYFCGRRCLQAFEAARQPRASAQRRPERRRRTRSELAASGGSGGACERAVDEDVGRRALPLWGRN